ncbi:MAG: LPS-assembly protein LptD [Bryobacterales bacterium]|nr:LPS-assembly protein LptD [Bryobacterales bacterium]
MRLRLFIPLIFLLCMAAGGQVYRSPILGPSLAAPAPAPPAEAPKIERADPPPPGIVVVYGVQQEREGEKYRLRQSARLESLEFLLEADEIDYDRESGLAEARGAVKFVKFQSGEILKADRVDYNLNDQTGTFYKVNGSAFGKIDYRPGILTTGNPFLFQGDWAEKLKDRYVLHNGTITNCELPSPWWTLKSPTIDIIPNERALAYKSWMRIRRVPVLYAPVFYKDLSSNARRSGFLTPNFGNSNRRGLMVGMGYFWAINRSYDMMYRPQYFSQRGLAQTFDFRGKPNATSDFDAYVYGVRDKGLLHDDGTREKQGGYIISLTGKAELPHGFHLRGVVNYLSNFLFRQSFTESFNEAVSSESNSVISVTKDWSTYHLNAVFTRQENFQSTQPGDTILIRKLPQLEFDSRDREINRKVLPVWVSWGASAGLVRRNQPLFQTRQFVERLDIEPRVMTALRWKDVHLIPSFSIRDTYYGSSFRTNLDKISGGEVSGANLNRLTREFRADLILPVLERTFNAPHWLGTKLKHTIEPRASFRAVSGVDNFSNTIRFDEMEILSNTSEVEVSLANRLWVKDRSGEVRDWLTLEVRQRRFFDQSFGNAVVNGQRNVFQTSSELTGYSFIDQPRGYSPIISALRAQPLPSFGVEWRMDYDPLRGKITNSSLSLDARVKYYLFSVGHSNVSCVPIGAAEGLVTNPCIDSSSEAQVLSPSSNQLRTMVGLGQENKRGWNAGVHAIYDYRTSTLLSANTQVTYNTNCCAFSGQYRLFNVGTRNENQFRLALVIANIGSFGTLRRQDRLF